MNYMVRYPELFAVVYFNPPSPPCVGISKLYPRYRGKKDGERAQVACYSDCDS
jgi:hypothetical protein